MAHTLKGSAANLGLEALAQLAAEMEQSLEQQVLPSFELLQQAQSLLTQVDDELSAWEHQHKEPLLAENLDWGLWYQQLQQAINDYDVTALSLSKSIRQVSQWDSAQQAALISAIEDFDFEQAKALLASYPQLSGERLNQ